MKFLIPATLAVILIHAALQTACGKQQALVQLARTGEMLSVIAQATNNNVKRSLVRPARQAVGSCSQNDVARLLGDYPTDCIRRAQFIDFDSIAAGDWDEYADFAASFCNERCGQPLVDLAYSCGSRAEGAALVYTCRVNENGMTCGRILEAVIDDGTAAENACLPPSTRCSTTCRRALQDFRDTGGCCANFTEVGSELNIDVAIDDFTLWNSCGVELTGLCTEGPLSGSGKALMAAKIPFIGLVIVVLAVLLL